MKFLKFWTGDVVLISSYPVSLHDFDSSELNDLSDILSEIMLIQTIVNPRLTMIVAVLYAVKFRIRLFSHFLFYLNHNSSFF